MLRHIIQNRLGSFLKAIQFVLLCVFALFVVGCTPTSLAVGGGATLGIAAAQEGGLKVATTDAAIRLQVHDLWFKHDVHMYRRLDMTVREGRVLLTGTVQDPDMRVDAVRLAWLANGVREVINEINVANSNGVTGFVNDGIITANIKSRLVFDAEVQSINYSIDTVDKVVYLMGVAQNGTELDRVLDHARKARSVTNVVSYVRMRGETPPSLEVPAGSNPAHRVPARLAPEDYQIN